MFSIKDRRSFLRGLLGSAGATALGTTFPGLRGVAVAQSESIMAQVLRNDLTLLQGAGGNMLLLRRPAGAVLVDSGSPEHAAELGARVSAEGTSVELLFNTHWHLDHTGANEVFSAAGATIVAHENTRLWMSTEYYVDWQDHTYVPRPTAALPTRTFYSHEPQPIVLELGSHARVEYGHLPNAHTDGDIYVFFPEHNVIAAGGAVAAGAYPVLDYATGGWIGGLMDSTRRLLELSDANTLVVPAIGPAQARSHLQAQYQMIATVRERVENLMRQGKSAKEMIAAGVTDEFDAGWGNNRDLFLTNVYNGLWWQGRLDGSL